MTGRTNRLESISFFRVSTEGHKKVMLDAKVYVQPDGLFRLDTQRIDVTDPSGYHYGDLVSTQHQIYLDAVKAGLEYVEVNL